MAAATKARGESAENTARVMTFTIDRTTDELLEDLKLRLRKTSKAEVLRKAIALLDVATEAESQGGIATIDSHGNIHQRIKLV